MTPRRKTWRPNFSAVARAARSWKASWAWPRDFRMSIVGKNGSSITGLVKTGLKGSANLFLPQWTQAKICLCQFGDRTLAFADGFAIAMRRRDSVPERGRDH